MLPTLIAHRCGPGIYPEQSMAAARHALRLGADLVEMDVRFTRDGAPVICHDANALRVFGVDRLCEDMTLREFEQLRFVDDTARGAHTLEDMLRSEISPILLHCKFSGERVTEVSRRILEFGAADACVLGVQTVRDVSRVVALAPSLRTLAFMPEPEQFDAFLNSPVTYVRLWEDWVTPGRIDAAHRAGKEVWVMAGQPEEGKVGYTDAENLRFWARMGADGILINDIGWALQVLRDTDWRRSQ